jgi:hypothetical protein
MRRTTRRALWTAIAVVIVVAVIAGIFLLRKRAAPEAARLLPEAEGYVYMHLKPLRQAGMLKEFSSVAGEPEYKEFVAATGFQWDRDLDEAAFAIHAPSRPGGENRYSEIFVGHIDTGRSSAYFNRISRSTERYREFEIYNIPVEGRTVRLALLGANMAAVTNVESPDVIHGMIDRYKRLASPFAGPKLLQEYYKHRPLGAVLWTILRVAPETAPPSSADQRPRNMFILPGGYDLFFPAGTVVVGSVRYTGTIDIRAEAFTTSDDAARRITDQLGAFLAVFRSLEASMQPGGPDKDVKAFFDSLKVEQEGSHAVLHADVPPGFLKKIFAEPPASELPGVGGNEQKKQQEGPSTKRRGRKQ